MTTVKEAIDALKKGEFVLIYDADGREEETDFVKAAEFATPKDIELMRTQGGGLIFLMIHSEIRARLGLPFLTDMHLAMEEELPVLKSLRASDIPYDAKSSFSLTINHRKTFTGITDNDRAMTVTGFAKIAKETEDMVSEEALKVFGRDFRSPGHVPICAASERILDERFGHTELSVGLLTMAGLTPVAVGCEIMGSGKAKTKSTTREMANNKGLVYLEGKQIIEAWKEYRKGMD